MHEETFSVPTTGGRIVGNRGGSGSALLLLHGGPGLTDYQESLAQELSPAFTTIRYQQRGLAPSTTSGPFTVESHVEDAIAVLDGLGIEHLWVVGHSWGGHLALHMALAHPDRVEGVISIDPLGAIGDGGGEAMSKCLVERLLPENRPLYEEIVAAGGSPPDDPLKGFRLIWPGYFPDPRTAPPVPSMTSSTQCFSDTWASINRHFETGTLGTALPKLNLPVWFVLGRESPIPVEAGEATAALIQESKVVILEKCGHLPWMDEPGCLLKVAREAAGFPPA